MSVYDKLALTHLVLAVIGLFYAMLDVDEVLPPGTINKVLTHALAWAAITGVIHAPIFLLVAIWRL